MKMTISSYDSSSISTLFSSLNSSRSTSFDSNISSMTGLLSEYNSIKTGSYYKLLKNYYSGERSNDTSVSDDKTQNNAEAYKKQLSELKTDATNLYDAANALLDKSSDALFRKVEQKDAQGNTSYGYDTDKIYQAVQTFVDGYNQMIKSGGDATVKGVLTSVSSMIQTTAVNESLLKSVGITIGSDNQLSINEDTFKKSDMTVAKSLFQTSGAYGYQIASKASMVRSTVLAEASSGNYTSTGTLSMNDLMNSYNSYI